MTSSPSSWTISNTYIKAKRKLWSSHRLSVTVARTSYRPLPLASEVSSRSSSESAVGFHSVSLVRSYRLERGNTCGSRWKFLRSGPYDSVGFRRGDYHPGCRKHTMSASKKKLYLRRRYETWFISFHSLPSARHQVSKANSIVLSSEESRKPVQHARAPP